jgi:hypothetical protein
MSKFLNLLNKYSSILSEQENLEQQAQGVDGLEADNTNVEDGGVMDNETENQLGDTSEAVPEIGDQDLIDVAKILSEFINDKDYQNPDKQNLLNILKDIDNVDVKNLESKDKIKDTIHNFVVAFNSKPSSIKSNDSTL